MYIVRRWISCGASLYLAATRTNGPTWVYGYQKWACRFVRREQARHYAAKYGGRVVKLVPRKGAK